MIIGVTADTQFQEKVLGYQRGPWQRMLDETRAAGAELLVHGGDFFETFNIAGRTTSVGTVVEAAMGPLRRSGLDMIVPSGNHDDAPPGQVGALAAIAGYPGVTVVTSPKVVVWRNRLAIAAMPWPSPARVMANESIRSLSEAERTRVLREKMVGVFAHLRNQLASHKAAGLPTIFLGHLETSLAMADNDHVRPWGAMSVPEYLIEEIGADAIFLGHFHRRQGYYVGAPWQLDHRYAGHPTGFVLYDTDTREQTWVELETRKFVALGAGDGVTLADIDPRHEYRGKGEPPAALLDENGNLPSNVIWVRPPAIREAQPRADVSAHDTPATLWATWAGENGVDLPAELVAEKLSALSQHLDGDAATAAPGLGALDRIRRVHLEHIGPHVYLDVRFDDGAIGLHGPNGVGKTWLFEAPVAVAYGEWPSRAGSLYDNMTTGFLGEGRIEIEFDSDARSYRALRLLSKSAASVSSKAYLFEQTPAGDRAIAGPKVKEFETAIQALFGHAGLLKASVFCSQAGDGDMTSLDPAGRREIVRRMLELDRLDAIAAEAKQRADRLDGQLEVSDRRLLGLDACERQVGAAQTRLAELTTTLEEQRATVDRRAAAVRVAEERLAELQRESDSRATVQRQVDDAQSQLADARRDLENAEHDLAGVKATLANESSVRNRVERLTRLSALLDALSAARSQRVEALLRGVRQTRDRDLADISAIEAAIANEPELRAKADRLEMLQAELEAISVARSARGVAQDRLSQLRQEARQLEGVIERERGRLEAERDRLRSALDRARTDQSRVAEAGCAPQGLLPCVFIAATAAAAAEAPKLEARLGEVEVLLMSEAFESAAREQLAAVRASIDAVVLPTVDEAQEARLRTERRQLEGAPSELAALTTRRDSLTVLRQRLAETDAEVARLAEVDAAAVRAVDQAVAAIEGPLGGTTLTAHVEGELRAKVARLPDSQRLLGQIEAARETLARLEAEVDRRRAKVDQHVAAAAALETEMAAGADVRDRHLAQRVVVADARAALQLAQSDAAAAERAAGGAERDLEQARKVVAELHQLRADTEQLQLDRQVYRTLAIAFGKDGIPQLIISAALPHIEQILAELMQGLDDRWAMRLETEATRKSGSTKETFDVVVADGTGARDVNLCSGGEKRLFRNALRIAFALFQAERSGRRYRIFCVDEAFDALDRTNAAKMLAMLHRLEDRFHQVFIVSHNDELLWDLPHLIDVGTLCRSSNSSLPSPAPEAPALTAVA